MTEHKFAELLGSIDPALIARAEERVPVQKRIGFKRMVAIAAAAMLVLVLISALLIIPLIPKTYDLEYGKASPSQNTLFFGKDNVWIYYTAEDGGLEREYVRMPSSQENVLLTWKHVNRIGSDVQISCNVQSNPSSDSTADSLWDFLPFAKNHETTLSITLSEHITTYANYETLIRSLQQTLAKYWGIDPEQVIIEIQDRLPIEPKPPIGTESSTETEPPTDTEPSIVSGQLEFSYTANAIIFMPGQSIEITVSMTNVSDTDVIFYGSETAFYPDAQLRAIVGDEVHTIPYEDRAITDDYGQQRLAPGQSRSITYVFPIPDIKYGGASVYLGTYELSVTFDGESALFPDAITIIGDFHFGVDPTNPITSEFSKFVQTYGFDTVDVTAFRAAVAQLSYQGKGMFEIMTLIPADFAEGYDGEEYYSDLFSYSYLRSGTQDVTLSINNHFFAYAIPDGMILPCNITAEDALADALEKLNFQAQEATDLINQKSTAVLASDEVGIIYFEYDPDASRYYISYLCSAAPKDVEITTPDTSVSSAPRSTALCWLKIQYSPDGTFERFLVTCGLEQPAEQLAKFTNYAGYQVNWTFSLSQTLWLQDVMDNALWVDGLPLYTDYRFEPMIRIGDSYVYYTDGYLISDSRYVELTSEQQSMMNQIKNSFPLFLRGPIQYWEADTGNVDAEPFVRSFDSDDVAFMLIILNRCNWVKSDAVLQYDYTLTVGQQSCSYSSSNGIFATGDYFTVLSEEDRQFVNAVVTRSNYQPRFSSIVPINSTYSIPLRLEQSLLSKLSTDNWYQGRPDVALMMQFDCDGTTVSYGNGVFLTDGQYMCVDSYTTACMDAMYLAAFNFKTEKYDTILYVNGEYYGHNAFVDQTHKDTIMPAGGAGILMEDIAHVFAGDDALYRASLWILGDDSHTVLYTDANGGMYFEKFTSIDPAFVDGSVRLVLAGLVEPCRVLTEKEAQTLRDVLERAEFYYRLPSPDPDVVRNYSAFIINGYEISYIHEDRLLIIGDWSAMLSERDAEAIDNVILNFIAVG